MANYAKVGQLIRRAHALATTVAALVEALGGVEAPKRRKPKASKAKGPKPSPQKAEADGDEEF